MKTLASILASFFLTLCMSSTVSAISSTWPEATVRGFPVMRTTSGKTLAEGTLVQTVRDGILHSVTTYRRPKEHLIVETSTFRQSPDLAQLSWDWIEKRGDIVQRHFSVDFVNKTAKAMKLDPKSKDGKPETWDEKLDDIVLGQTFAGGGFIIAIKALHERIAKGEHIELSAVAMAPKPTVGKVDLYRRAELKFKLGGREFHADHIVLHPKVNPLIKLVINPKDNLFWFSNELPSSFLRFEGPLVEIKDDAVRVDLM